MRLSPLERLARLHGIQPTYIDGLGATRHATADTFRALLAALGVGAATGPETEASLAAARTARWTTPVPPAVSTDEGTAARVDLRLRAGDAGTALQYVVTLEDGGERNGEIVADSLPVFGRASVAGTEYEHRQLVLPADLPAGVHRLVVACGSVRGAANLIVAPRRCYLPPELEDGGRVWGLSAQLYGLRSERNWGVGDFSDLGALTRTAAKHGAAMVGINPLHPLFPADPGHSSPYAPSTRVLLNVLYLDVERVPEYASCAGAKAMVADEAFQTRLAAAREGTLVDYAAIAALKLPVLELLYAEFRRNHLGERETGRGRAFGTWAAAAGTAMTDHALFDALHEHLFRGGQGPWNWRDWPEAYRHRDSLDVTAFARDKKQRVMFYAFLQWEADRQLTAVQRRAEAEGMPVGLYLDIAVAVDPGGSLAWSRPGEHLDGVGVGAPPDAFNLLGQNWGAAAFSPHALRATGYRSFRAALRASMGHGGAVRIDHAMGLQRLFCIPDGAEPADGAYLHYPCREMRRIVTLESHRNRCLVVGEDLGTVPAAFRGNMHDAAALSYRVFYFERGADGGFPEPDSYPAQALVTASTHDLPTLSGFWAGRDLALREEFKLYSDPAQAAALVAERHTDRRRLLEALVRAGLLPPEVLDGEPDPDHLPPRVSEAVHAWLSRTPGMVLMVQAEDVIGEIEQANLPGTSDGHPNWRRRLALTVDQFAADPRLAALGRVLVRRSARATARPASAEEGPPDVSA